MMNKCVFAVLLCLAAGASGFAQEQGNAAHPVSLAPRTAATSSVPLAAMSSSVSLPAMSSSVSLAATTFSAPLPAAAPKPEPRFVYGSRDDYRWQLGFAYAYFRIRTTPITANLHGIHTSVVYYTNEWFGLEGAVTAAFGSQLPGFDREHSKLVTFSGGPRIAWRQRRWEPWGHFLVGGAHLQAQTALGGRNSIAYTAGGGADFRWNPRLSFRFQGDYVGTRLFDQTQHNFQITAGPVFHF